jgi:tetratricopeptide (TPR) repeat protein
MEPRKLLTGLGLLFVLLPHAVLAQFDLQELIRLQGESANAAYSYAQTHRAEQEGDPDFDFYYGVAAIDTGNVSQGVFALERVLAAQPNNHAARLELARGYFILEEYARAREEFEAVMAMDPPPSVVSKIDRFISVIRRKEGRYRTTATGFVQLGAGTDTNVSSGPNDPQIGSLRLSDDSVEIDDEFWSLVAAADLNAPLTANVTLFGSLMADVKAHWNEDQFNNHTLSARGGLTMRSGQNHFVADLQYENFVFDGSDLRNLASLNGSWRRRSSARSQFSLFTQLTGLEYPDQEVRDSSLFIFGGGYSQQFSGTLSPVLFASAYLGTEEPDNSGEDAGRVADRELIGARVGGQINVSPRSTLLLSVIAQDSDYAEPPLDYDTLAAGSGSDRSDEYVGFDADWTWLLNRNFSVRAHVSHAVNDSNDELNEFERTIGELSVRAEFN